MTYQEFKKSTVCAISAKLGSNYRVALQDIIKNNDTHLDGLTILTQNSNISPTIYLNYYYNQYLSGKSLSAIYDDILHSYQSNMPKENFDISFFTDFSKVKEHIIFKLVNYERNLELLSKIPHVRYLDLAIVFNCLVEASQDSYATILIHNHHLSFWNIREEQLYELAMKNTPKLLHYHLQNMADVITELFCDENSDFTANDFRQIPMYVLTNSSKLNGSGCILYKNLLADISRKMDCDFYILPSSVHEVLLIPSRHAASRTELEAMVQDVNATQLASEEILSDSVYFYSRKTDEITM